MLVAVLTLGGAASFCLGRRPAADAVGAGTTILVCLAGFLWSLRALSLPSEVLHLPWRLPPAAFIVGTDSLSAFFLVAVFGLGGVAAVYGASHARGGWLPFDLMLAGMALLLLARNGVLFLAAWELTSISAWFLVVFEHERAEARQAGWVYLVAAHMGAAALVLPLLALPDFSSAGPANVAPLFLLGVVGFGAKAGIVPFHVWLPGAHAVAPSHVSALLSGVMVKMGIYGILRLVVVLGGPPGWFGPLLLALGLCGTVAGIGMALSQRDMKRALAYSSIENVGIILLGLGLGFWGWSTGRHAVAAAGLLAGLVHVWNHALMKGLLFLGAGTVLHATGTRDLERLGGLFRRMPRTGAALLLGAAAVAALPPLNGFLGEWLLVVGFATAGAEGGAAGIGAFLAIGVLALAGALAAAAFARLLGVAFGGEPRSTEAAAARDPGRLTLAPLATLALGCVAIGLFPHHVVRLVAGVATDLLGVAALPVPDVAPLGGVAAAIWIAVAATGASLAALLRRRPAAASETWGCGYVAPDPRMQYTARAFAQSGADALVPGPLRPTVRVPAVAGPFPATARLEASYGDPAWERGFAPFFRRRAIQFTRLRQVQQGKTWFYVGYIAVALVLGLAWSALREWRA